MKPRWIYCFAALVALVLLVLLLVPRFLSDRRGAVRHLAVLPLENLSGNPDHEFYADGMTEALIDELSKIESLRVISRTSIMRYKGSDAPPERIARELKLDAVIRGAIRRSGDRIRAEIELIRAEPEQAIWAKDYERGLEDILIMQEEIVRDVADRIEVGLTPEERARLSVAGSIDPMAHEAYLMGRSYINRTWTKESVDKGIACFERAIALDAENTQAYAGLARSYDILASFDWIAPEIGWSRARSAAMKALKIDGTNAEAHIILADVEFMFDWDWEAAERDFREAIELSPGSVDARIFYAGYLMLLGRFDEAFDQIIFAAELDPHSFELKRLRMICNMYSRRFEEARTIALALIAEHPGIFENYYFLGWIYKEEEQYDAAIEQYRTSLRLPAVSAMDSMRAIAGIARAYALSGEPEKARALLGDLVERSERADMTPYIMAKVFSLLGEADLAFEWLEKAYRERSPLLTSIKIDPELEPIRSDPRFRSLMKRMGVD